MELLRGRETTVVADLEGVVGSPSPALDVAAGVHFTCAVNTVGQAFCWGRDEMRMGVEEPTARVTPVPLPMWPRFVRVTAGDYHAGGLTPEGEAYCWGWNVQGQVGDGTTTDRLVPTSVAGGHTFSSIDAGAYHVCGLEGETALCWGGNGRVDVDDAGGPLGFSPPEVCPVGDSYFGDVLCSTVPRPVEGGLAFASVSGGGFHSCGATTGGEGYCWGWNLLQQIGVGPDTTYAFPFPQRVAMEGTIAEVHAASGSPAGGPHPARWSAGATSSRRATGRLRARSLTGASSATGPSTATPGRSPSRAATPSPTSLCPPPTASSRATRADSSAPARRTAGASTTRASSAPNVFPRRQLLRLPEHAGAGLGGHTFTKVSLGENHACGVATNGTLYCWGGNDLGQLGDGTTADRSVPTPVAAASSPAG